MGAWVKPEELPEHISCVAAAQKKCKTQAGNANSLNFCIQRWRGQRYSRLITERLPHTIASWVSCDPGPAMWEETRARPQTPNMQSGCRDTTLTHNCSPRSPPAPHVHVCEIWGVISNISEKLNPFQTTAGQISVDWLQFKTPQMRNVRFCQISKSLGAFPKDVHAHVHAHTHTRSHKQPQGAWH